MNFQDGKLKNIFWLRPAYQRYSWRTNWRSINKSPTTLTLAATMLLLFLSVLFVSLSAFTGWIDLGNFSSVSYENALKLLDKTTKSHPPPPLEYPIDCVAWEHNKTCPSNYPTAHEPIDRDRSSNPTCPDYFRWIHEDLKPWKGSGITRDMVERARDSAHFRLVILNGKVYLEKFRDAFQTRALFTIWGIVQLQRWYPGRLPDLELMFDCDDLPVIPSKDYPGPNAGPPALFRYYSNTESLDIVFPEFSFWGWPEAHIKPWRHILKDIKEGSKKIKWKDREPYAFWRGNPHVAPCRGELMACNLTDKDDWNSRLFTVDWNEEEKNGYKNSNLGDQCTYRYKIYIEGSSASGSEKYIFACNSPVLVLTLRFHDFFVRGMIPQQHYWPIQMNDKCRSLKFAVEYGNNHTEKAQAIGTAGSRFMHEDVKMEYVFDYIFHLFNEYAKLLKFKTTIPPNAEELCPEFLACSEAGNVRKFLEQSLEKSPSNSIPCTLPPSYDLKTLKAFNDDKIKLTKEVENWENKFWAIPTKNH